MTNKNRLKEKKETMASRPFATISDQESENLRERAIPKKTKTATKYGMKIFNGKLHVCMHMKHNFVQQKHFFSQRKLKFIA